MIAAALFLLVLVMFSAPFGLLMLSVLIPARTFGSLWLSPLRR